MKTTKPSAEGKVCQQVVPLFTELALFPSKDFGWGSERENARVLGYDPAWSERLPEAVWKSSAADSLPIFGGRERWQMWRKKMQNEIEPSTKPSACGCSSFCAENKP